MKPSPARERAFPCVRVPSRGISASLWSRFHHGEEKAMADIATRVYNHTWKIDPIVRSVLDTDFYKLLMAQTIFRRHRDVQVTFGIHNRTTRIRLADIIDAGELREQLDHVRSLSLTR